VNVHLVCGSRHGSHRLMEDVSVIVHESAAGELAHVCNPVHLPVNLLEVFKLVLCVKN